MLTKIPNGYEQIVNVYGNPSSPGFASTHLVTFDFPYPLLYESNPVKRGQCHRLVVDNFIQAFTLIEKAGFKNEVLHYAGIYNYRPIRGRTRLSLHAFGVAIDLESEKYRLGSNARFPQRVVDIFKACGFFYGGDFKDRKDPMHFQLATGY